MANHYELIYTSVPRGLRAGSQGFCTVATTANMPTGLIGPLENLSAYRHIEAAVMPVNFSHVRMKVAGRNINVISRIGDAGADYTGRTNKIAHHIVVDAADRPEGGPAALLMESDLTRDVWDREPGELPPLASLPQVQSSPRVARQWAAMAGDAGWAGHVASHFVSGGPTMWLVYRPDQNDQLLEMIDESLSILTPSQRWDATFATYCGDVAPGVTLRLRCVLAGSPEAASAAAHGGINIASGSLGSPPESPYVEAARRGVAVAPLLATPVASVPTHATSAAAVGGADEELVALQPPLPPAAGGHPVHSKSALPPALGTSPKSRSWLLPATAVVVLLMLAGAGGAIWVINEQRMTESMRETAKRNEVTPAPVTKPAPIGNPTEGDSETVEIPTETDDEPRIATDDPKPPESAVPSPETKQLDKATELFDLINQTNKLIIKDAKQLHAKWTRLVESNAKIQKQTEYLKTKHRELDDIDVLRNSASLDEMFLEPANSFNKRLQQHLSARQELGNSKKSWVSDLTGLKSRYDDLVERQIDKWQDLVSDIQNSPFTRDQVRQWKNEIKDIKVGGDPLQSLASDADILSKRFIVISENDLVEVSVSERHKNLREERESHTMHVYLYLSGGVNNIKLNVEMRCDLTNEELSQCSVALADANGAPGPGSVVADEFRIFPNQQLYLARESDLLNLQMHPSGGDLEFSRLVMEFVKSCKPVISQFKSINSKISTLKPVSPPRSTDPDATQRTSRNVYALTQKAKEMMPEFSGRQSLENLKRNTNDTIGVVTLEGDNDDSEKPKSSLDLAREFMDSLSKELERFPRTSSAMSIPKPEIQSVAEQLQRYLEHRDDAHEALKQLQHVRLIDFNKTLVFIRSDPSKTSLTGNVFREEILRFDLVFIPKFHYDAPPR